MTAFWILSALGLVLGVALSRLAARGRRIRLAKELREAEAMVERLGYIEVTLRAYPFGESLPQVAVARASCEAMRAAARRQVDACRAALAGRKMRA